MTKFSKLNKGITLIVLIITVIIMTILISITTYTWLDGYKDTQITKFITQMKVIQIKVDELKQNKETQDIKSQGSVIDSTTPELLRALNEARNNNEIIGTTSSFRYFSSEKVKSLFELEDKLDGGIMINFDTREVVSPVGIECEGVKYYTQYKLSGGQKITQSATNIRTLGQISVTPAIDGLNAIITISNINITNGKLMYGIYKTNEEDIKWKMITNYTEKDKLEKVQISTSGNYIFKLEDNNPLNDGTLESVTAMCNLELTNAPKSEGNIMFDAMQYFYDYSKPSYDIENSKDNWAFVTVESNGVSTDYVWVPRFVYKIENDITTKKFIKGNSNIATDNTYIDTTWTTPEEFGQKTGIWKEVITHENLDLIVLVTSPTTL